MLYRALLIGTDLAAATRPLHLRDTGNPTCDVLAVPTSGYVVGSFVLCVAAHRVRDQSPKGRDRSCVTGDHLDGLGSRKPGPATSGNVRYVVRGGHLRSNCPGCGWCL